MVWKGKLLLSSQQLLVGLLHVQLGQQEGDQGAEDGGQPQVHNIQHGDDGLGLRGSTALDEARCGQQPAGDRSAQTAADLDTQGGAGVHGAVDALAGGQIGVVRSRSDNCVQIALQGAHTQRRDSGEDQHHGDTAHVSSHDNQDSCNGSQSVTAVVDLVHAAQLCNHGGHQQQADDHGDVQCGGKLTHQVLVAHHIGHVVGANTGEGGVQLGQQIELVLDQQASVLLSYSVPSMMFHTTNFDQRSYRHPTAQR